MEIFPNCYCCYREPRSRHLVTSATSVTLLWQWTKADQQMICTVWRGGPESCLAVRHWCPGRFCIAQIRWEEKNKSVKMLKWNDKYFLNNLKPWKRGLPCVGLVLYNWVWPSSEASLVPGTGLVWCKEWNYGSGELSRGDHHGLVAQHPGPWRQLVIVGVVWTQHSVHSRWHSH